MRVWAARAEARVDGINWRLPPWKFPKTSHRAANTDRRTGVEAVNAFMSTAVHATGHPDDHALASGDEGSPVQVTLHASNPPGSPLPHHPRHFPPTRHHQPGITPMSQSQRSHASLRRTRRSPSWTRSSTPRPHRDRTRWVRSNFRWCSPPHTHTYSGHVTLAHGCGGLLGCNFFTVQRPCMRRLARHVACGPRRARSAVRRAALHASRGVTRDRGALDHRLSCADFLA